MRYAIKSIRVGYILTIVSLLSGCNYWGNPDVRIEDARSATALKSAIVEAAIFVLDNSNSLTNADEILGRIQSMGPLLDINSYGRSNIFFNPDLKLWISNSAPNQELLNQEIAILLRRPDKLYSAIRFDYSVLLRTQKCPVVWGEGKRRIEK